MSLWVAILLAAAIAFGTKLAGHLVPAHLLERPRVRRLTGALPIALLAALVATQAFTGPGGAFVLDARAVAVAVAVVALLLRAPFLVVVVLGAATAAVLRALGWA
ncbi:MAG TPA: AzlD domain-containing protein [Terrabacter sp.]|nr:AzlD domain-containing protein [Terrabacter sp.]